MAKKKTIKSVVQNPPEEDEVFEKRQKDWEVNHELICEAFFSFVLKNKKYPTYATLAKQTNLNERTIRRHLQDTDIFGDLKLKLKAMSERSLITIGIKAVKGESVAWSKLFHEIVDGVGGEKEQSITININGKRVGANN